MLTTVVANRYLFSLLLLAMLAVSCGDGAKTLSGVSPEEEYRAAMAEFEEEDYKMAQEMFSAFILQHPAVDLADDAQFYLAESYFRNEEFKLAAMQYNRLRTSFPTSPFGRLAFYRSAEAYELSAPGFERDQTYTKTALTLYKQFEKFYPSDTLADSARARIVGLNEKLASKDFSVAEHYFRMDEYRSALIYYEVVLEKWPTTSFVEAATIGRIKCLQELNRHDEAQQVIDKYMNEHPGKQADPRLRQLQMELGPK